ncbi:MAG: hypothetical protein WCB69_05955, partial [Pseudolabrys sp.]
MLCHAIIPAEEISGHVEASQREVLGTAIEHVREASIGEEHLGVGGSDFWNEVEHDVAFGGANAREVHAGKRAQ